MSFRASIPRASEPHFLPEAALRLVFYNIITSAIVDF
jgi:hypothetical protein